MEQARTYETESTMIEVIIKWIVVSCVVYATLSHTIVARGDNGVLKICGARDVTTPLIKEIVASYEHETSQGIKLIEGIWRKKAQKLATGDIDIVVVRDGGQKRGQVPLIDFR